MLRKKKVILSGMGADELFGGYRKQKAIKFVHIYQMFPKPIRYLIKWTADLLPVKVGQRGLRFARWIKRFLDFAELPIEEAFQRSYTYYNIDDLSKLFKFDITKEISSMRKEHQEHFEKYYNDDYINQMCYTDVNLFMKDLNLTYTDRAAMAASVEVRVPFIDREVVNMAMSIPGNKKIKRSQSKFILKKIAESFLPDSIVYRPKAAFGAPIRAWISNELRETIDKFLSKEKIDRRGIFEYSKIKKMIDDDRNGVKDYSYQIYQFLTLEIWFETFMDK